MKQILALVLVFIFLFGCTGEKSPTEVLKYFDQHNPLSGSTYSELAVGRYVVEGTQESYISVYQWDDSEKVTKYANIWVEKYATPEDAGFAFVDLDNVEKTDMQGQMTGYTNTKCDLVGRYLGSFVNDENNTYYVDDIHCVKGKYVLTAELGYYGSVQGNNAELALEVLLNGMN